MQFFRFTVLFSCNYLLNLAFALGFYYYMAGTMVYRPCLYLITSIPS